MNRGMLFSLVNVSLVAGLALAVSSGTAQQPQPAPTLVYTACGHGTLTVCGSEPVGQRCVWIFGAQANKTGDFGFNFGGYQCTGGGQQNRYKDFNRDAPYGTCYVLPRPAADATSARTGDAEAPMGDGGETSSC